MNIENALYVLSSVLFIFGIKRLSHPKTARSGNFIASMGMLIAIVTTLLANSNISIELIKNNRVVAILKLNDLEPFSYAISNFCWGLDKQNKPVVKAINNDNSCPRNTKAKAYKLESPYTYKF